MMPQNPIHAPTWEIAQENVCTLTELLKLLLKLCYMNFTNEKDPLVRVISVL